ncbi:MAG: NUDIX domain-containing protein [Planctomycetota bacterium]
MKEAPRRAGTFTVRRNGKGKLRVLLVTAARSDAWILPMGKVERGEDAAEAAARETEEESGYRVDVGPWLAELTMDRRGVPGPVDFFLAGNVRKKKWDERDKRERKWVSVKEIHEWLPEDFRPVAEAALEHID